jgi:hypothetical protein
LDGETGFYRILSITESREEVASSNDNFAKECASRFSVAVFENINGTSDCERNSDMNHKPCKPNACEEGMYKPLHAKYRATPKPLEAKPRNPEGK